VSEIEALKARVKKLEEDLKAASAELLNAEIAATGISVGDIVIWKGKEVKVTRVRPWVNLGKPWIYGLLKVKDGSWGKAERALYSDWTMQQ
jgi:hypothetical protein